MPLDLFKGGNIGKAFNKMDDFSIKIIRYTEAKELLQQFHYMSKSGGGFRSGINYGLFFKNELVGCCIYISPSGYHTKTGLLGKNSQYILMELGRLVLNPCVKKKCILSWFVAKTFKLLKAEKACDVILTYADSRYHTGKIYQALSMTYHGLTAKKKDFYFEDSGKKQRRGPVKNVKGTWIDRPLKHRYTKILNKNAKVLYKVECYPKKITQCYNYK